MASQRITIAKIGGQSALAAVSLFAKWAGEQVIDDPIEWGPDQWPAAARREMDAFATELRRNGRRPPIVFFCEYVDLWSMGDLFGRWLAVPSGFQLIELHSDQFELWCYPFPDGGSLAESLQKSLKLKRLRERDPQEDRWFVTNLLEATLAWHGVVDVAALVVLREVFGGLVEDAEIQESLESLAPWIVEAQS